MHLRSYATLGRSLRLLRSFPLEQKDPQAFYTHLALDTLQLLQLLYGDELRGTNILDVGGGPGYFQEVFRAAGINYYSIEPEAGMATIQADGRALPLATGSMDIVYSSNVAEHIDRWEEMAEEMWRVTRPGGLCLLSYTVWLGPFGGHETGLWQHYIGGAYARRAYRRKHGHEPKNRWGESLFAVSCAEGLRWAQKKPAARCFPRYHPWWAWWVVRVPVLREFLTSNLVIALRRSSSSEPQTAQEPQQEREGQGTSATAPHQEYHEPTAQQEQ